MSSVMQCYMHPWSISELIAGYVDHSLLWPQLLRNVATSRSLQKAPCSEAQLNSFIEHFGGSARSAYTYAHECHLYEGPLIEKLATISCDDLGALI